MFRPPTTIDDDSTILYVYVSRIVCLGHRVPYQQTQWVPSNHAPTTSKEKPRDKTKRERWEKEIFICI